MPHLMIRAVRSAILALAACAALPASAQTQETIDLPLWELGVAFVGRTTPAYPGADDRANRVVALPVIAYRGRLFELGEDETVRFVPFQTDRLEFALSIDGSARVERQGDPIRGDLPPLDPLAEFGPEVIYSLGEVPAIGGPGARGRIELGLQTRGVFSIDGGIDHEGYVVRPLVRYRQNGVFKPGSRLDASIGPTFASEGVQGFYYDTDAGFEADAGYLGTEATASFRYPITRRARVFAGVGLSYLGGAANEDSPLFESNFDASASVGIAFSLFQSEARAIRDR